MLTEWLDRTRLLVGQDGLDKLSGSHVLVAGLGGVGAYAAEMIARAGVGQLTLVDADVVHPSNLNRQLLALGSTLGQPKAALMAARLRDICPGIRLNVREEYIRDERTEQLMSQKFDYVVDAIDTLAPKVFLLFNGMKHGQRMVSSMGAGGKMDPAQIHVADLFQTRHCRLAHFLRKRLRKLGVGPGIQAVYSTEFPMEDSVTLCEDEPNKKSVVGTISYMPALFGCYCASVVIRDLLELSPAVRAGSMMNHDAVNE